MSRQCDVERSSKFYVCKATNNMLGTIKCAGESPYNQEIYLYILYAKGGDHHRRNVTKCNNTKYIVYDEGTNTTTTKKWPQGVKPLIASLLFCSCVCVCAKRPAIAPRRTDGRGRDRWYSSQGGRAAREYIQHSCQGLGSLLLLLPRAIIILPQNTRSFPTVIETNDSCASEIFISFFFFFW